MRWFALLFHVSVALASDLIDADCNDFQNAKVKVGETAVTCGREYSLNLVSSPKIKVTFDEAETGKLYVIMMVDPDAPSHTSHSCRSWLHYIRENVKGSDLRSGRQGGDIVTEYAAPTPPADTGYHRYFVYVFEQKKKLSLSNPTSRCKFDISTFAKQNCLTAVATNMFKTQRI